MAIRRESKYKNKLFSHSLTALNKSKEIRSGGVRVARFVQSGLAIICGRRGSTSGAFSSANSASDVRLSARAQGSHANRAYLSVYNKAPVEDFPQGGLSVELVVDTMGLIVVDAVVVVVVAVVAMVVVLVVVIVVVVGDVGGGMTTGPRPGPTL